jgi:sigma54-dependent transcription regulator
VHVDFRLICATNIDLDVALREGKLREDLYFRINTITLRVPPMRERSEDIPLLCNHFLSKFNQRYQKSVRSISPAAYHLLIRNRVGRERARTGERHRAGGARLQDGGDRAARSARGDSRRRDAGSGVHYSAASHTC